jgi:hypothetical protein
MARFTTSKEGMALVEILTFPGCPHEEAAVALVGDVARELDASPIVQLIEVHNLEQAVRLRFLGAPTIRIDGRDVEPRSRESHRLPDRLPPH